MSFKPIIRAIPDSQLSAKICWLMQKLCGAKFLLVFWPAWKKLPKEKFEHSEFLSEEFCLYIYINSVKRAFDVRTCEGTEELIQSDEVQSAVDDVVNVFDEIKNAFKGFINVNCDDLGKIRETAYQGPK